MYTENSYGGCGSGVVVGEMDLHFGGVSWFY
jgi:hypothetical protein